MSFQHILCTRNWAGTTFWYQLSVEYASCSLVLYFLDDNWYSFLLNVPPPVVLRDRTRVARNKRLLFVSCPSHFPTRNRHAALGFSLASNYLIHSHEGVFRDALRISPNTIFLSLLHTDPVWGNWYIRCSKAFGGTQPAGSSGLMT